MTAIDGPSGGPGAWEGLAPARRRAGLSAQELYLRYVALGGSAPSAALAAHCATGAPLDDAEHDLAVLALNERFLELDDRERLPFTSRR